MTKVIITLDVAEESADPDDPTGVTSETYDQLTEFLMEFGDDIEIKKA